jgi:GntR family histidine utilization transcriptional repressor
MTNKIQSLQLSSDTSVPVYQRIKNAIRQKIKDEKWLPGEKIPSENELVAKLGVSRMTINRSLRELSAENLLRRVHGMGTFVAEPVRHASLLEIKSITDEIAAQGKTHHSEVQHLRNIHATRQLAERLNVPKGALLFELVAVHFQDNIPIQFEKRYVNPKVVPDFMAVDFTQTTSTNYLISFVRPDELEHVVQAIMPDKSISAALQIPLVEPCLLLKRRTWVKAEIVTAVDMIYPSSRYDLGARYLPTSDR